ncbi:MAG: hypothetical protein JST67_08060 [Bacteroidetes bacterium]|nr:hypothetical protein [Bacteroidota bacterium]
MRNKKKTQESENIVLLPETEEVLSPQKAKKIELVVVFHLEVPEAKAQAILEAAGFPYKEGAAGRGKIYFYSTGPTFIVTFDTKKQQKELEKTHKKTPEIYEMWERDKSKRKD